MTTQGPRLTFRVLVDTTADLLAPRLRSYRRESGWLVGDVWHELSPIRESEDTHGHTKLLLTEHTDATGALYPPSIRYILDDLQPPQAARVLLTIYSYLHSHAVVSYTYQVFSSLMADYPAAQVEYLVPFVLKELSENLHKDYSELIDLVERLGGRQEQSLRHVMGYGSIAAILAPDARKSDLPIVTWILDTNAGTFATWLLASWPESAPIGLDTVTLFLGQLRQEQPARANGPVGLVMRGHLAYGDFSEAFTLEQMPDPVIHLALFPLAADRVEARLTWRMDSDGLRVHLVSVLDAIVARWPELRRTIQGPLAPSPKPQTYREVLTDELRITRARDRMLDRIVPEQEPPANAAQPAPWVPLSGAPTREEFPNWEELQQARLFWLVTQTTPASDSTQPASETTRQSDMPPPWDDIPSQIRLLETTAQGLRQIIEPAEVVTSPQGVPTRAVGKTKQEQMAYRREYVRKMRTPPPKMTIEDLAEHFSCTESTIKRDVKFLIKAGQMIP